jgi:hypothetical protein
MGENPPAGPCGFFTYFGGELTQKTCGSHLKPSLFDIENESFYTPDIKAHSYRFRLILLEEVGQ